MRARASRSGKTGRKLQLEHPCAAPCIRVRCAKRRCLAGTTSAPFETGEHRRIAVKVIDDRGNELLLVEDLGK